MQSLANIKIKTEVLSETCKVHPEVHLEFAQRGTPFCPVCQKEKMEQEKIDHDRKAAAQLVRDVFLRGSLFDKPTDKKKTFENYEAEVGTKEREVGKKAYAIALDYINNPNKPMKTIFSGNPGQGKTHLAIAIANKVNSESNPPQKVLFLDANELYGRIMEHWNNPGSNWSEFEASRRASQVDLLIIDDLGSESSMKKSTTEASNSFQRALKKILDRQPRIIITTNSSLQKLNEVYNPKLVSRIFENSLGRRIDFGEIKDKRFLS